MSSRREASGGHVHLHHVQAVVEVLAEAPLGHLAHQILVGGGDDAHVHLDGLRAAQPLELALLEHAQELHLGGQGHLAHLVEEEGAAVGALEAALAAGHRAGEGAPLDAEELRLEDALGEGAAVDGDEGALGALGLLVEGAGGELLAGAGLAQQEHGGGGGGGLAQGVHHGAEGGGLAHHGATLGAPISASFALRTRFSAVRSCFSSAFCTALTRAWRLRGLVMKS